MTTSRVNRLDNLECRVWGRQNKPQHPWILVAAFRDVRDGIIFRDINEKNLRRTAEKWEILVTRTQADPNEICQHGHDAAWDIDVDPDRNRS